MDDSVGLVICKMLGIVDPWSPQKPARVIGGAFFGSAPTTPILLNNVRLHPRGQGVPAGHLPPFGRTPCLA